MVKNHHSVPHQAQKLALALLLVVLAVLVAVLVVDTVHHHTNQPVTHPVVLEVLKPVSLLVVVMVHQHHHWNHQTFHLVLVVDMALLADTVLVVELKVLSLLLISIVMEALIKMNSATFLVSISSSRYYYNINIIIKLPHSISSSN
jgi:hypothetical protein